MHPEMPTPSTRDRTASLAAAALAVFDVLAHTAVVVFSVAPAARRTFRRLLSNPLLG